MLLIRLAQHALEAIRRFAPQPDFQFAEVDLDRALLEGVVARNSEDWQLQAPPHSARTNVNVGADSTAIPRAFRTCLSVSVLPSMRKR